MKKFTNFKKSITRYALRVFALCILVSHLSFLIPVSAQSNSSKGMVNVTLEAGDIWTDGSGYQMLLDPTATAYGTLFDEYDAMFTPCGDSEKYDEFPYKIPENADPDCATENMVLNSSATIQIPAGVYDFVVVNPRTMAGWVMIPTIDSYARKDDFVFEEGFNYTFIVSRVGGAARVDLTIEEVNVDVPGMVNNLTITPGPAGALTAVVSWENPSQTLNGATLTDLTAVKVYQNNEPEPVYVNSNPEIGAIDFFTATVSAAGEYTFTVVAENTTGLGTPKSETTWIGNEISIATFPWIEGFENETFPPLGWNLYQETGFKRWDRNTENSNGFFVFNGTASAFHDCGAYWDEFQESWLITPKIVLPSSGSYNLEFWSNFYYEQYFNINDILLSTTGNNPATDEFVLLKHLSGNEVTGNLWQEIKVSLDNYLGEEIYIAFRYRAMYGPRWFLDDVKVTEIYPVDATVEKVFGALTAMAGEPFKYKALVKNVGSEVLSDYTVVLIDDAGNVLTDSYSGTILNPEETAMIEMIWTPATDGEFAVHAKVAATGDSNPTNDISPAFDVTVLPENNSFTGTVGNENIKNGFVPFDFFWCASRVQTLYFDHELMGRTGVITEVHYFNDFVSSINKPVKIWMLNTEKTTLDTWHLPFSDFNLVYDGTVHFLEGQNMVTIPLDKPFLYTGQNLLLMTDRIYSDEGYSINNVFYCTKTQEFPDRCRFSNNLFNIDLNNPAVLGYGTGVDYHANTNFTFVVALGSISGTITEGTNPVQGASVEIMGANRATTTDENGNYNCENLLPGNYQIKITAHGYYDVTTDVVEVVAYENSVVDINLIPLPLYTVSGKVTGNDAPNGIENVQINLSGYESYSATTDANGNYSISNVYGDKEYGVKAEASGYVTHHSSVNVVDDVTFNILLNEIAYHVVDPVAEIVGENVEISWLLPGTLVTRTYTLDDGTAENGSTFFDDDANLSLGNIYEVNEAGEILSVDVYGKKYINSSGRPLTIRIYNEKRELVGESEEFTLPEDDWINVPLNNVPYSGTFYAMLFFPKFNTGFANFLGIDMNGPYSQDNLSYSCQYGIWFEYAAISVGGVFMIRVNATSSGKAASYRAGCATALPVERDGKTEMPAQIFANSSSVAPLLEVPVEKSTPKSLQNYSVYRLVKGQPEASWTLLSDNVTNLNYTDKTWNSALQGWYQWAVKVNYSGGVVSEPRLTNVLGKNMYTPFTIHLTLNSGDPVTGAVVTLTNLNENYTYSQTAENSTMLFSEVVKGTYKIEAKLKGYTTHTETIEISNDGSHNIMLNEIFNVVVFPKAQKSGNHVEVTWEDPTGAVEANFRYDSGFMDESLGFPSPAPSGIMGSCHRENAKLTKIQWFLGDNIPEPATHVDIFILELSDYGMPIPKVIYHAGMIPTAVGKWVEYEFPTPVSAPKGFFMALSRPLGEFLSLGISDGTQEYPFMKMTNFYSIDYTTELFTPIEYSGIQSNFMLRAEGYVCGKEAKFGAPLQSKAPLNYMVYRLPQGQPESAWTLLSDHVSGYSYTDETSYLQPSGSYQWAVKVKYTAGISEPRLTNVLQLIQPETYTVTFNILDNATQQPVTGATVVFDGEKLEGYMVQNLLPGKYTYNISKEGFTTITGEVTVVNENVTVNILLTPLSIHAHNDETNIQLYPNPFKNEIYISHPELVKNVQITDVRGQIVKRVIFNGKSIATENLSSGVYFIKIERFTGEQTVYKMVNN